MNKDLRVLNSSIYPFALPNECERMFNFVGDVFVGFYPLIARIKAVPIALSARCLTGNMTLSLIGNGPCCS
jgi:hypothetical protein